MRSGLSSKTAGLTLVELMVATAIIGIVSVTVMLVFRNSISHAAYNYNETAVISEKIQAVQYFRSDFTSALASSVGSLLANGNFEQGSTGWPTAVTGTGSVAFTTDVSTSTILSGHGALALTSSDGSFVYVQGSHYLTVTDGSVYFLTGYVRANGGGTSAGFSLTDDSNNVLLTTSTTSTSWTKLWIRFPASGSYAVGDVSLDRLHLRVFALGGTSSIYADDIAFAPKHAVLVDSTLPINVPTVPTGGINDPAGFRFQINEESGPVIHRYRVENENGESRLLHENFNGSSWIPATPSIITRKFSSLQFLTTDPSVDPDRSRLPVEVRIGFLSGTHNNMHEKLGSWSFTPLVQ